MTYKIEQGAPLYDKMADIFKRGKDARSAAFDLAEELGAIEGIHHGLYHAFGGISDLRMKEKPNGWANGSDKEFYYPIRSRKSNKDVISKLDGLPVVHHDELNKAIGFEQQSVGRRFLFSPEIKQGFDDKVILVKIQEGAKFKPVDGMIEILMSEYNKLYGK